MLKSIFTSNSAFLFFSYFIVFLMIKAIFVTLNITTQISLDMRNRILFLIFGVLLTANFSFAQKCGTYEGSLEEDIQKYPDFYQSLESKNAELKLQHEEALSRLTHFKTEDGVKIIPV